MHEIWKIFIHRLKEGTEEKISESVSPDFLEIQEEELVFRTPVSIEGSASVSQGNLLLQLAIHTEAVMPCAICNEEVRVPLTLPHFYHLVPCAEIKNGIFDFKEAVREAILLELPYTVECYEGSCPERACLAKYVPQSRSGEDHGSST